MNSRIDILRNIYTVKLRISTKHSKNTKLFSNIIDFLPATSFKKDPVACDSLEA